MVAQTECFKLPRYNCPSIYAGAIRTSTPGTVVFHGGEFVIHWSRLNEELNSADLRKNFVTFLGSLSAGWCKIL